MKYPEQLGLLKGIILERRDTDTTQLPGTPGRSSKTPGTRGYTQDSKGKFPGDCGTLEGDNFGGVMNTERPPET